MYCGPGMEGRVPVSAGPREEVYLLPNITYPTPRRNQAASVSWLSSSSQKPERRKQIKGFCCCYLGYLVGGWREGSPCTMWGTIGRNKTSPQSYLCCINMEFYSWEELRLIISIMFKCPQDCLKILSWCISFENRKNIGSKREREKEKKRPPHFKSK